MIRRVKQIFLILASSIICMHNTYAESNLPPLPISDDNAPVVTQTTDKSALNAAQEAPEAVNIDQFISDVDKKITEKAATDGVEEGELQSTNSNKVSGTVVPQENNNQQSNNDLRGSEAKESKVNTTITAPTQETSQEITTITEQQIAPTSTTNTAEPSVTPPVDRQPDTQDPNIKTTGPLNSTPVVSEKVSANSVSPAINNPGLLVPAYDSETAKSEQLSPKETKILSNSETVNNQQTVPDSFISDELTVVLNLAPDDIAVGSLTKEAYLDQLSFSEYQDIFWKKYYESQRTEQRKAIELFISDYDKKFNQ